MILKKQKPFFLIGPLWAIIFSIASEGWTQPQPQAGTKPPIITHSYAVDKGRFGYTWKIYIESEDEDADMLKIACAVDQVGYGFYSRDFITIKPPDRRNLKGYIQWNTFSVRTHFLRDYTQISLKISIIDKAGNESKEVIFPFEFVSGLAPESNPPAPFDKGDIPRLGNIMINLSEPALMGPGNIR